MLYVQEFFDIAGGVVNGRWILRMLINTDYRYDSQVSMGNTSSSSTIKLVRTYQKAKGAKYTNTDLEHVVATNSFCYA